MEYKNLHQLIQENSGTRNFFFSLPVDMQISLHEENESIHTSAELHRQVHMITEYDRMKVK